MAACVCACSSYASRCALLLAPSPRSGRRRSKRRRGFQLRSRKLLGTARPSSEPIRKARERLERGSVTRAKEKKKKIERARDDDDDDDEAGSGDGARGSRYRARGLRPIHPKRSPPSVQGLLRSPPREAGACLEREKRRQKTGGVRAQDSVPPVRRSPFRPPWPRPPPSSSPSSRSTRGAAPLPSTS